MYQLAEPVFGPSHLDDVSDLDLRVIADKPPEVFPLILARESYNKPLLKLGYLALQIKVRPVHRPFSLAVSSRC